MHLGDGSGVSPAHHALPHQNAAERRVFNRPDGRCLLVPAVAQEEFIVRPAETAADGFAPVGEVSHPGQVRQDNGRKRSQAHDDGIEQAAQDRRIVAAKRLPVFSLGTADRRDRSAAGGEKGTDRSDRRDSRSLGCH